MIPWKNRCIGDDCMIKIHRERQAFIRPVLFWLACIIIVMSSVKPGGAEHKISERPNYTTVTYFHNSIRCFTCRKIEELSAEIVKNNFADELKNGTLIWRVINVDEPENQHYADDYKLYTKSLIVSEMQQGKEIRWKNLEKIWTLIRDDAKFEAYITSEIQDWIEK